MTIPNTQIPHAGNILRLMDDSAKKDHLFLLDPDAVKNTQEDVYHHQIVANLNFVKIETGTNLTVVHFFDQPQFIRYVPDFQHLLSKKKNKKNGSPNELRGYIAYVLYQDQYWATDVFESLEDFLKTYEVVI